jgi:3-dehydroquinate synthase
MKKVKVSLGARSYSIVIGRGVLDRSGRAFKSLDIGRDAFVITNARLVGLYGARLRKSLEQSGFSVRIEKVPDSEKAKSIAVATRILNRMSAYDVGKKLFVIAFGGGVIGDLAGFVASAYKRGIPYAQIPTTLLAQVDSSIGGKAAVDLPVAKNLVGAIYQPKTVLADTSLIGSLPKRQIASGLAEVIKYGVIGDRKLFAFLERNIRKLLNGDGRALEFVVSRCAAIKARIVAKDELDRIGIRAVLNYGHTIGHAVEAASSYSGRYNHGEAVAIGMIAANAMSASLGLMKDAEALRIQALVKKIGLPTAVKGVRLPAIYASHLHDKKFTGATNRFVLPLRIGAVRMVQNVPDRVIRNTLKELVLI